MLDIRQYSLAFAQGEKLPLGGSFSIMKALGQAHPETHMIHKGMPFLEMISMHASKTHHKLMESLRTTFKSVGVVFKSTYRIDGSTFTLYYDEHFSPVDTPIVPPCYDIQVRLRRSEPWRRLAIIYNGQLECVTYSPSTLLFTIDTQLRFLYAYEFLFDDAAGIKDISRRCIHALKWQTPYFRTPPAERFTSTCFGTDKSLLSLHKIRWDKKIQTVIHIPKEKRPRASKSGSSSIVDLSHFFSV